MTTVRVRQEWEVHRPRQESILSGLLAFIGLIVAAVYMIVGLALIIWMAGTSPVWCAVGLVLYGGKRLCWRR